MPNECRGRRQRGAIFLPFLSIHPSSFSRLPSSSKTRPALFPPPSPWIRPSPVSVSSQFRITNGLYDPPRSVEREGEGKPVASNGSDKKFSRSPRTGDKVVHSPLPLHWGGIGFSAFHRSPTDFYFDTQHLECRASFLRGSTRSLYATRS